MAPERKPEQIQPEPLPRSTPAVPPALDAKLPKKLADLLAQVTEQDLRGPERSAETLKGTTDTPHAWIFSPATVKFSALAQRRLVKAARDAKMGDTQPARVHARLIGESNTLLIKVADPLDLTAFEVSYYKGAPGGTVNLYDLLGPARATVETGFRKRFDVHFVPKGHPLWPGLLIDLDEPTHRKTLPPRTKEETEGEESRTDGEIKADKKATSKGKGNKSRKGDASANTNTNTNFEPKTAPDDDAASA